MNIRHARQAVALTGNLWRLRFVEHAERDTPATRRALQAAADKLDEAIANQFETVYKAEYGRNRRKER